MASKPPIRPDRIDAGQFGIGISWLPDACQATGLLRCSTGVSTPRERPPRFSDVYHPIDRPGRVNRARLGGETQAARTPRSHAPAWERPRRRSASPRHTGRGSGRQAVPTPERGNEIARRPCDRLAEGRHLGHRLNGQLGAQIGSDVALLAQSATTVMRSVRL